MVGHAAQDHGTIRLYGACFEAQYASCFEARVRWGRAGQRSGFGRVHVQAWDGGRELGMGMAGLDCKVGHHLNHLTS